MACGDLEVDECRLCAQAPEKPDDILSECPALSDDRVKTLEDSEDPPDAPRHGGPWRESDEEDFK